jgi:hypothetical protein
LQQLWFVGIKSAYMQFTEKGSTSASSASISASIMGRQLSAMACSHFEIGVLRPDAVMLPRIGVTPAQVYEALHWLRRENARGAHIFIRPQGASALTLIDDVDASKLETMKQSGFEPALVVETSPANFQAWLKHSHPLLDHTLGTIAARELAARFGGDLSSAGWRHFGRLAGFTNQKEKRRLPNGLPPYVRLRESRGETYRSASQFLEEVERLAERARAAVAARLRVGQRPHSGPIRTLSEFHRDPRYAGDLHRADMAWAVHAARRGVPHEEIAATISRGRDLSKKGGLRQQLQYAARTAGKALIIAGVTSACCGASVAWQLGSPGRLSIE